MKIKQFAKKGSEGWFLTHLPWVIVSCVLLLSPTKGTAKILTNYTGYLSVWYLLLVLSLNPLIKLFPQVTEFRAINRYRKEIGVASFSFALLHFLCFIIKKNRLIEIWSSILTIEILPAFFIALPILFILAITSNKFSKEKLGRDSWKSIHKKVYIAELAIFVHMLLSKEIFWALTLFTPIFILQFIRKYK